MMPAWLASLCRRILSGRDRCAFPVCREPRPTPAPPPARARSGDTGEPDLSLIGTRALYEEIAKRYDASVLVCARHGVKDPSNATVAFLCVNVTEPAGFLRAAAALAEESQMRDLGEDDL